MEQLLTEQCVHDTYTYVHDSMLLLYVVTNLLLNSIHCSDCCAPIHQGLVWAVQAEGEDGFSRECDGG